MTPDLKSLSATVDAKRQAHHARLLEKAKGRGLFSWGDVGHLFLLAIMAYLAFFGKHAVHPETVALIMLVSLILQWHSIRLTIRLNALVDAFMEQETERTGEARKVR